MAVKYTKPRGVQDVLPDESRKWEYLENIIRGHAATYGYGEIRLPTFESTDLFARGVGDTTDIVSKEMYTFEDKGGRSMTLRPEGTAGVVRATLENGLLASAPTPLKMYYLQSCFRYEKAQKGRLREFHQFGIECFGTHEPSADVETMQLAASLFKKMGIADDMITLEINAIGCPVCRPAYQTALKAYFEPHRQELCPTCQVRLDKNPLRILDCKEERCAQIAKDAPVMLDHLCEDCSTHFASVQDMLAQANMPFAVNPHIVRGLDYYTNTVFEFIAEGVGTQGTVCAGGRYDGLIQELGGQPTPAVGFGMGVERLLMLMEENELMPSLPAKPVLYAVAVDEAGRKAARKLVAAIRATGEYAEYDIVNRSVKAQMKAAGRLGAAYTIVLGESEIDTGKAKLKKMEDGTEIEVNLAEWEAKLLKGIPFTFLLPGHIIGGADGPTAIFMTEKQDQ